MTPLVIWASRPIPEPFVERLAEHRLIVGGVDAIPDDVDAMVAAARPNFGEEFMRAHPQLRVIARTGTGFDSVDVDAATRHDILVCTNPGDAAVVATAEHALALLFAASKKLEFTRHLIRTGEQDSFSRYTSKQLGGACAGIIGYGRIGQAFAKLVRGLGLEVAYYDPWVVSSEEDVTRYDDLPTMLANVDVVSLHAPLTPATSGLVDASFLAAMRPGSVLVNTSKGALIDEQALADALESGHLFAAGLDASHIEPMPADAPLYDRTDVVLSPQVGASTHEAKASLWNTVIDQILAGCAGDVPVGALNPQVLTDASDR
jgi:phosphoglycerate dehydrogenase-like enzyme